MTVVASMADLLCPQEHELILSPPNPSLWRASVHLSPSVFLTLAGFSPHCLPATPDGWCRPEFAGLSLMADSAPGVVANPLLWKAVLSPGLWSRHLLSLPLAKLAQAEGVACDGALIGDRWQGTLSPSPHGRGSAFPHRSWSPGMPHHQGIQQVPLSDVKGGRVCVCALDTVLIQEWPSPSARQPAGGWSLVGSCAWRLPSR